MGQVRDLSAFLTTISTLLLCSREQQTPEERQSGSYVKCISIATEIYAVLLSRRSLTPR